MWKDKDQRNKYEKSYRSKNRERINKYKREWALERRRKIPPGERSSELAKAAKYARVRLKEMKAAVVSAYGGKCSLCGESNKYKLTIDHVSQSNPEHISGSSLYRKILREGFPAKYRILCLNCNRKEWISYIRRNPSSRYFITRPYHLRRKQKVLNGYGGSKCTLCGISDIDLLTLDHINGGGKKHRRCAGFHGGADMYGHLIKSGFPTGYRVLCFSCNIAEYRKNNELT